MISNARSAGIRVVHTFELLEHILFHLVPFSSKSSRNSGAARQTFRHDHALGMKTLLQYQQVNKTFQSTIVNSKLLRRALFFEQPVPWDVSKGAKKNAILMSNSWRVSPEIIVDVRARLQMSRKGQPPKISVQMEPKYDRGKTADQQHSWRKMCLYDTEYRVDRIRMSLPSRTVYVEIVPQRGGSLTAGAIWEEVLGDATGRGYFEDCERELQGTVGSLVDMTCWNLFVSPLVNELQP